MANGAGNVRGEHLHVSTNEREKGERGSVDGHTHHLRTAAVTCYASLLRKREPMSTTLIKQDNEELIELLTEHIRNWRLLLEEAIQTEDGETVDAIQERLREARQQLNAIRANQS